MDFDGDGGVLSCFVECFASVLECSEEGGFAEVEPAFVLVFGDAGGVFGRFGDGFGEVGVGGFVEGEFSEFNVKIFAHVAGDGVSVNF